MGEYAEAPRGRVLVLAAADSTLASAIMGVIADAGFEPVGVVEHWSDALEYVIDQHIEVVVVDLTMGGRMGTRVVSTIRAAGDCEVFVISPLQAIDVALAEAGAAGVVSRDDLRPLAAMLRRSGNAPAHL
ncbi:response regulator [Egicoccus sp. AB-alg6-2]|uniref:response regulator n=1 Tax=Egicoccus sp. AB-alg6-2 TaxID=3242692 RepID=UPI00359DF325